MFASETVRYIDPATEFPVLRLTDPSHTSLLPYYYGRAISRRSSSIPSGDTLLMYDFGGAKRVVPGTKTVSSTVFQVLPSPSRALANGNPASAANDEPPRSGVGGSTRQRAWAWPSDPPFNIGLKTPIKQSGLRTATWMWVFSAMPEPENAGRPSRNAHLTVS